MLAQTWAGVPIHICMACGANFFQAGELGAWQSWGRDLPAAAERTALHSAARVHCPDCGTAMERIRFPLTPVLEIERCPSCRGILLDFEEIRRIPEVGTWAAANPPQGGPGPGRREE
jgi:Zn-finger nucleic acid-binding protein